jgi:hypothetical protein
LPSTDVVPGRGDHKLPKQRPNQRNKEQLYSLAIKHKLKVGLKAKNRFSPHAMPK